MILEGGFGRNPLVCCRASCRSILGLSLYVRGSGCGWRQGAAPVLHCRGSRDAPSLGWRSKQGPPWPPLPQVPKQSSLCWGAEGLPRGLTGGGAVLGSEPGTLHTSLRRCFPSRRIFVLGIGFFTLCFLMTSLGGQFSAKRLGDSPFTIRTEGKHNSAPILSPRCSMTACGPAEECWG